MPISDALHELIKSLEPTEKRHFKIFAKRHILNGENQYLRLFELVETMTEYEEAALKTKLGKTRFAENLSSSKNYLYNLILRSLRSYNAGASAKISLQELRLDIHTLVEKGLLTQATKLIKKAKRIAAQHQYDVDHLDIVLLERKLIRRYTSNKANERIQERQMEADTCIRRVQGQFQMLNLYETVFLNYRNNNEAQESLSKVVQQADILSLNSPEDFSFEMRNYYHLLHLHHANMTKNFTTANHHLRQLINLQEENPFLIEEDQERYINHLNNYLNNCLRINNLEEFPLILMKMQTFQAKSFKIKALVFNHSNYLKMLYHHVRKNEYQAVIKMIPDINTGLQTYAINITKSRQLTFFYNIAMAFFMQKDYANTLEWINRILNEPKSEERQDIRSQALVFQLVIHFELGNTEFVESLVSSVIRYLIKKGKRNSAEFLIVNHLKDALYADRTERRAIFQQLSTDLQAEKGLEEIKIWVEGRLK